MAVRSKVMLLFLMTFSGVSLHAQNKIVFRQGIHRAVIKPGKVVGVTQVNEPYHYSNWKSVCKGCYLADCMDSLYNRDLYVDSLYDYDRDCADTVCYNNIWTLDSVKEDYIVVRKLSEDTADYHFDTIAWHEHPAYTKKMRKKKAGYVLWDVILPPDSNFSYAQYVYGVPINYVRQQIPIDSIQSMTFSEMDNCSTFDLGPVLLAAIAIIGAPIVAYEEESWAALVVGEALGAYLVISMYKNIQDLKVKRYNVDEWKVKVR